VTEPTQLGCEEVVISIDVVDELDEDEIDVLDSEELVVMEEVEEEVIDGVDLDVSLSLESLTW
jgi:hypothetical protein